MDRRKFLKHSLATTILVWAGSEIPKWLGMSTSALTELFAIDAAVASSSVFPQSVASGDPQPDGITLWTRVGSATGNANVAVEIASDPAFTQIVLRGISAKTNNSQDYILKARISSKTLQPGQTYYYRFIYKKTASQVGRFKTLPAPNAELNQVRFAYISCQDYTNGYYTAFFYLAQEDIDFVVHLGDYIYETVADPSFQGAQVRTITLPSGRTRAETLEDYRFLYKTYRSDPNLQRLHEQFAFINIWDDHEFANDCYQQYDTDTNNEQQNFDPQRRQAANQAWAEYTPTSITFDPNQSALASLQIYRSFAFGNLMELVMTDERLYRDGPPCGIATQQRYLTPGCPARENPNRTMLGTTQRQWFLDKIKSSPRIWKIWGNETMVMQLKLLQTYASTVFAGLPTDIFINLDQWDGYPAERTLLFREIRDDGVKNFVTITGDLHTFIAGYQKVNYDNPVEPPVSVCFMGGSVTSSNLVELATLGLIGGERIPPSQLEDLTLALKLSNPHLEFFNSSRHGYNLIEVTPQALTCTMKVVDTIKQPSAHLSTLKVFRVPRDQVLIQDISGLLV